MSKLLEHFKSMQAMASRYVRAGAYVDRDGKPSTDASADGEFEQRYRAHLFLHDMLHMLDSPEQRAAERDHVNVIEAFKDQVDVLEQANRELADKHAVHESDAKRAIAKLDDERVVSNDLRDRLMASELAYTKMVGYLEGRRDAEPPPMVPQVREPMYASMPDASGPLHTPGGRSVSRGYHATSVSGKTWYHR